MRLYLCTVVIALWAIPLPRFKTVQLASALPAVRQELAYDRPAPWHPLSSRAASSPTSALVASVRARDGLDVVAAEGEATMAPAAANGEEVTTEEPYDAGDDGGGDFGADILNTLLEVIGTLLSFFSDPPGAIQKMVEQAQKLTGTARSLMATVRQEGVPGVDTLISVLEQVPKLANAAIDIANTLGPAGARAARGMLEEAKRILETAQGLVEAGGKVANTARSVVEGLARPFRAG